MPKHDLLFEPFQVCGHRFPSSWRYILPKAFAELQLPREQEADCTNCLMAAIGEYLPTHLCCTHLSQVPNFQIGLALLDPRTKAKMQAVIKEGYALPTGIEITPNYHVAAMAAHKENMFGKSDLLLCPFMDGDKGGCTVYAYRTPACSTFHCAHDHCDAGSEYWDSIEVLATRAELAISQWAMKKVGMDVGNYMHRLDQLAKQVTGLAGENLKTWSKAARAHLFGNWYGTEEAFFIGCAKQVMTHRDELWTIGCKMHILEATKFEQAVDALLAENEVVEEGVEIAEATGGNSEGTGAAAEQEDDADEQGDGKQEGQAKEDTVLELWRTVQQATYHLWQLPQVGTQLILNPGVRIHKNPQDNALARFYSKKEMQLVCSNNRNGDEPLIVFLTNAESAALQLFKTPQIMGPELFEEAEIQSLSQPRRFFAEFMRADIIQVC